MEPTLSRVFGFPRVYMLILMILKSCFHFDYLLYSAKKTPAIPYSV